MLPKDRGSTSTLARWVITRTANEIVSHGACAAADASWAWQERMESITAGLESAVIDFSGDAGMLPDFPLFRAA